MEMEEVRKRISDAKTYLEDYRMYGRMVADAIDALDRLDGLVADPTERHLTEALKLAEGLNEALEPYRSYVPTPAEYMDQILGWLKSQTG
ncbi:hypothetical protein DRO42_06095 [Candidatus Bathyarchaeota archaeon]|nr:MAG: hypothetical protein DRO42_06095 [Candidatus Bathyarchaeota archaeon]